MFHFSNFRHLTLRDIHRRVQSDKMGGGIEVGSIQFLSSIPSPTLLQIVDTVQCSIILLFIQFFFGKPTLFYSENHGMYSTISCGFFPIYLSNHRVQDKTSDTTRFSVIFTVRVVSWTILFVDEILWFEMTKLAANTQQRLRRCTVGFILI